MEKNMSEIKSGLSVILNHIVLAAMVIDLEPRVILRALVGNLYFGGHSHMFLIRFK